MEFNHTSNFILVFISETMRFHVCKYMYFNYALEVHKNHLRFLQIWNAGFSSALIAQQIQSAIGLSEAIDPDRMEHKIFNIF